LIKAESGTIRSVIHWVISCMENKEVLPEQWQECVIVPIYKKGDKRGCSNHIPA